MVPRCPSLRPGHTAKRHSCPRVLSLKAKQAKYVPWQTGLSGMHAEFETGIWRSVRTTLDTPGELLPAAGGSKRKALEVLARKCLDKESWHSYMAKASTGVVQAGSKGLHCWKHFLGCFGLVMFGGFLRYARHNKTKMTTCSNTALWELAFLHLSVSKHKRQPCCPTSCPVYESERHWKTVERGGYLSLWAEATASQTSHAKRIPKA